MPPAARPQGGEAHHGLARRRLTKSTRQALLALLTQPLRASRGCVSWSRWDTLWALSRTSSGEKPGRLPAGHHSDAGPRFGASHSTFDTDDPDSDEGVVLPLQPEEVLTPDEDRMARLVLIDGRSFEDASAQLGMSRQALGYQWKAVEEKLIRRARRSVEESL